MIKYLLIIVSCIIPVMIWSLFGVYAERILILYGIQMLLFILYFLRKNNSFKKEINSFNDNIEALINGEKATTHYLKDETLSKIYHQLMKFSSVLNDHHQIHLKEKDKLESLIGDLSHQLKTPIANLKMYLSLLGSPEDDGKKMFYDALINQCDHLEFLVDALMKLSKIEADCLDLNIKENDVNQLILNAIGVAAFKAEKKSINITYKPMKLKAFFDKRWSEEVLNNIIDNGIKYSPPNSTLHIECEKSEMFTKIIIKDEGIGVKEEELQKIFNRFYRGTNSSDAEGVGIGLYLAQGIMNEQGGYIYANSLSNGMSFEINFKN